MYGSTTSFSQRFQLWDYCQCKHFSKTSAIFIGFDDVEIKAQMQIDTKYYLLMTDSHWRVSKISTLICLCGGSLTQVLIFYLFQSGQLAIMIYRFSKNIWFNLINLWIIEVFCQICKIAFYCSKTTRFF